MSDDKLLYCSFCGRRQDEVWMAVGGIESGAIICDVCLEVAADLLCREHEKREALGGMNANQP